MEVPENLIVVPRFQEECEKGFPGDMDRAAQPFMGITHLDMQKIDLGEMATLAQNQMCKK